MLILKVLSWNLNLHDEKRYKRGFFAAEVISSSQESVCAVPSSWPPRASSGCGSRKQKHGLICTVLDIRRSPPASWSAAPYFVYQPVGIIRAMLFGLAQSFTAFSNYEFSETEVLILYQCSSTCMLTRQMLFCASIEAEGIKRPCASRSGLACVRYEQGWVSDMNSQNRLKARAWDCLLMARFQRMQKLVMCLLKPPSQKVHTHQDPTLEVAGYNLAGRVGVCRLI